MGWRPICIVVAGVALMLTLSLLSGVERARADCLYAEVFVERKNESTVYPLGSDPCLTPTSGGWMFFGGPVDVGHEGVPSGAPKRVYVDVRIPVP